MNFDCMGDTLNILLFFSQLFTPFDPMSKLIWLGVPNVSLFKVRPLYTKLMSFSLFPKSNVMNKVELEFGHS